MNVFWQPNSHHFECIPPPSAYALLQDNVDIVFVPKNGNVDVAVVNFSPLVCITSESRSNMYDKQSWSIYKDQNYI